MNKTIGLFAHVDAGKTTFAEQILYHTKSIRSRGRVDHKNSFLDSNKIEKERGITVFSGEAVFKYKSSTYYLIDTPGHADFSPEMERTIEIMDYAILIISAVEGVQAQSEIIWDLLRKHKVPTILFINKMDREGANVEAVVNKIKSDLSEDVFYLDENFNFEKLEDNDVEFIAERDESLLEMYLESGYKNTIWRNYIKKMIASNKIFPCMSGSALNDIGIEDFLEKLDEITFTNYNDNENFSGIVYKIKHDDKNKLTCIKILKGILKVKQEIKVWKFSEYQYEKVNEIRVYNGNKFESRDEAHAGEIVVLTGLSNSTIGHGVGDLNKKVAYDMVPTMKSKVIFDEKINVKDVLAYFKILESEDPSLQVMWDESLSQIEIHIMGKIQLEVLKELAMERFGLYVDFETPEILYKETILNESIGYGHFEPLRHYAEVNIKLEPGKRNSGITFKSLCHVDNLSINYQNLIKKHIYEREHHGILTGSPLTDIKITLLNGRSHIKHTSGGDFREATYRTIRHGLESARNVLLEPYYCFKIKVDIDYMGRVISDIQKLSGSFETPETYHNKVIIKGRGPAATFMDYGMEFTSFTKGRGKINFTFDGYDICHNEEEVIKKVGYNKDADIEYTAASIFCSKGQAFLVSGDKVKEYMHCLK